MRVIHRMSRSIRQRVGWVAAFASLLARTKADGRERAIFRRALIAMTAAGMVLAPSAAGAVDNEIAVVDPDDALARLLDTDMTHEQLNGLRALYESSAGATLGGQVYESARADEQAATESDIERWTDAAQEQGWMVPEVAEAISHVATGGLTIREASELRAIAAHPGSANSFVKIARVAIPDRWDSMVVRVTVNDEAGISVAGATVDLTFNGVVIGSAESTSGGIAEFDIPFGPLEQQRALALGHTFGIEATHDSGTAVRTGILWARGQWNQALRTSPAGTVEHFTHGSVLRELHTEELVAQELLDPIASSSSMCTGHSSTSQAPGPGKNIKIAVVSNPEILGSSIQYVTQQGMRLYVKEVLPSEWIPSWGNDSLGSGGLAVKQYAWFRGLTEAHTWNGNCWDVKDSIDFQRWIPGNTHSSTNAVVNLWWDYEMKINGNWFEPRYWSGYSSDYCGRGKNGTTMRQWGTQACDLAGENVWEIVETYYYSGSAGATVTK